MLINELLVEQSNDSQVAPDLDIDFLFSFYTPAAERRAEMTRRSFERLQQCIEQGEVVSTEFNDLKSAINRFVEDAFKDKISEKFFYAGKYQEQPEAIHMELSSVYEARLLPSMLKKFNKLSKEDKETPVGKEIFEFINTMMPLARCVEWMKTHKVAASQKRKEAAEAKAEASNQYQKKLTSHKDVKKVIDLLKEEAKTIHAEILKAQRDRLAKVIETFDSKREEAGNDPRKVFGKDVSLAAIILHVFNPREGKYEDDVDARLDKMAKDTADEIVDGFVYKNAGKISYIIATKGNMKKASLGQVNIRNGVIESQIFCEFKDGSRFAAATQVVVSFSKFGTPFLRFPTTFHNVIFPDGSRMSQPSEQKMEEEFAIAT